MQEVTVREAVAFLLFVYLKATRSILKICELLTPDEINEYITAAAIRMHNGEWFTSKYSVL